MIPAVTIFQNTVSLSHLKNMACMMKYAGSTPK